MRLALYQPEIPQNTGTLLRMGSCLGVGIDIIEPCGFAFSDRKLQRAGMDYLDRSNDKRHESWEAFSDAYANIRQILITTETSCPYTDFNFKKDDILLVGQESCGFPQEIEDLTAHKVTIPMQPDRRSLNVAMAAAIVVAEAIRQTSRTY